MIMNTILLDIYQNIQFVKVYVDIKSSKPHTLYVLMPVNNSRKYSIIFHESIINAEKERNEKNLSICICRTLFSFIINQWTKSLGEFIFYKFYKAKI